MPTEDRLDRLGAVAAHLPFPLEDYDAANRVFCQWIEQRDDADLQTVEVWLYCYVQRSVLRRLLRAPHVSGSEAEEIIDEAFGRARSRLETVSDPSRFTHWVSVVCRNTFLNGLRRHHLAVDIDDGTFPEEAATEEAGLTEQDRALVRHAVARAVEALPEALRPVARMRFLEGRSYGHIAATTAHPLPTVRAYAAKAVARFREDPELRALAQALDLVPP